MWSAALMAKHPLLEKQILGPNGWQSVAAIVAAMQAAGVPQVMIDRWLQGLGRSLN
jgi:hypothetical protein